MNQERLNLFESAQYLVSDPFIEIKINQRNSFLDAFLVRFSARSWAFITPFNPGSQKLPDIVNESRYSLFKKDMEERYIVFEGNGGGNGSEQPLEKSLLILKVKRNKAKIIGREYGQDAIVFGRIHKPAEILVLNPEIGVK